MPSESQPVSKSHYDFFLFQPFPSSPRARVPSLSQGLPRYPRGDWHILLGYYRNYIVLVLNNRQKNLWQSAERLMFPRHKKKLFTQLEYYIP